MKIFERFKLFYEVQLNYIPNLKEAKTVVTIIKNGLPLKKRMPLGGALFSLFLKYGRSTSDQYVNM